MSDLSVQPREAPSEAEREYEEAGGTVSWSVEVVVDESGLLVEVLA